MKKGVVKRELDADTWLEEFQAFRRMGMSLYEIARAFNYSLDTLEHRIRRSGINFDFAAERAKQK